MSNRNITHALAFVPQSSGAKYQRACITPTRTHIWHANRAACQNWQDSLIVLRWLDC